MKRFTVPTVIVFTLMIVICASLQGYAYNNKVSDSSSLEESKAAFDRLKENYTRLQVFREGRNIARLYGQPFGSGQSPVDAAEQFKNNYSRVFGVKPVDLIPVSNLEDGRPTQQLMFSQETEEYKFTLVYYSQYRDGIPVFRSDLRLLVRNEPGYPLVLASSALKDIGDFKVLDRDNFNFDLAMNSALAEVPDLVDFTEPKPVIWAGINDIEAEPAFAIEFIGSNDMPAIWLFIADAITGEILYKENQIIFEDVEGNVDGYATQGSGAEHCEPEAYEAFRWARVNIGSTISYTEADGSFVIPNGGSSPVTVESRVWGQWFRVYNYAGSDALLTMSVTPPGPANFYHNSSNTEYYRAQVNGYVEANVIRDLAITHNPSYPTLQNLMPVYTNRSDGYCPGNAWYSSSGPDINFCSAGSGYPNTAWANIVHHEYGHHLVYAGGSGQGQYGEGMGDCMGILTMDESGTGFGFFGDCNSPLREADNNFQYPCSGPIHDCGQLLSGCIWSIRNELVVTEPFNYLSILANLTINSILLHTGNMITPSISIDFLILDDDDGDIDNGTPHFDEITAGFEDHNMMAGPPPENDNCSNAIEVCPGTYTGNTSSATNDGSSSCGSSNSTPDLWYSYTPISNGTLNVNTCTGTGYDCVLSVHTGCPGTSANEIGCDDDGCGPVGGPSTVAVSVAAGNTYYIRVTGWSGSVGNFTLSISGPDCDPGIPDPLTITFPDGLPEYLEPGVETSFNVIIEDGTEIYVPGSGILHYRYDGGIYLTSSLTPLGGDLFEASLPAANCEDNPEFYISAEGNGGSTVYSPYDAPNSVYTAIVGIATVFFEDHFDTHQGWTISNSGGLIDGAWQRGIPAGDGDRGDPPNDYDIDGLGYCYVTDNADGNSDVDEGYTWLISPTIDLGSSNAEINYALWYTNHTGDGPNNDYFKTFVSNNNGGTWVLAETIGPYTSSGWTEHSFTVGDFVTPTSQVKFRFEASDVDPQSIVEAGIDAVIVTWFECDQIFTGSIAGVVEDAVTGLPIQRVNVEAVGMGVSDVTDIDGHYELTDLAAGFYDVSFSHEDYRDSTETGVEITYGNNTILNMSLQPLPTADVGVSAILSPLDSILFETPYPLEVEVTNHGVATQTFNVVFEVYISGSSEIEFSDLVTITDMPQSSADTVAFSSILIAEINTDYDLVSYTILAGDEDNGNDTTSATSYTKEGVLVKYGNLDGSPINGLINGNLAIDVYVQTSENAYLGDLHLCLGSDDQYIEDHLSETLGQIYYPLTEWEAAVFTAPHGSPPNPAGWASQSFVGFARINPGNPNPLWLHLESLTRVMTFVFKIVGDESLVGQTVECLGQGLNLYQGPSNGSDSTGFVTFDIVESYSPVQFYALSADVGVSAILSPPDSILFETPYPLEVEVANHGVGAQTFDVVFEVYISGSSEIEFSDLVTVTDMPQNSADTLTFSSILIAEINTDYDLVSYTILAGDEDNGNDTTSGTSYTKEGVLVKYGNLDGSPINGPINGNLAIDVYVQTSENAHLGDLHLCLGSDDQYIEDHLSETLGQIYYPLTEWETAVFTAPHGSPPNPGGWTSQSFVGFARINPNNPNPLWLHLESLTKVMTFVFKIVDDEALIGQTVECLGQGLNLYQGPSNGSDSTGFVTFDIIESYSPVQFYDLTAYCDYVPGDFNGDGNVIGGDVTFGVQFFTGVGSNPPDSCWLASSGSWLYSAADANGDCLVIGSDITYLVAYFVGTGGPPQWCPETPPANPLLLEGENEFDIPYEPVRNR